MIEPKIVTLLFILIHLCSYGQAQSLDEVIWEMETNFDYFLEDQSDLNFMAENGKNGLKNTVSKIEAIKVDITAKNFDPNKYLTFTIIDLLLKEKLKGYSIREGNPLSVKEIRSLVSIQDTVVLFNPETYQERIQIIENLKIHEIESFIIRQEWRLFKSGKLTSTVVGLIPIMKKQGRREQLFWIPLKENNWQEEMKINDPEFIWIKYSSDLVSFKKNREDKGLSAFKSEFWTKAIKGERKIYTTEENIFFAPELPADHIKKNIAKAQIDTVYTYDPETLEGTPEIFHQKGKAFEDIEGYKIHQLWYFNHKEMTLDSKLIGIAPLVLVIDSNGWSEYYMPLYNMKFEGEAKR